MKKWILLICLFTLTGATLSYAAADRPIEHHSLPQKAQNFIKQHFPKSSIALAKVDTDLLSKSYEVRLNDGTKLEFDSDGEWSEVKCSKGSTLPAEIIPKPIAKYLAQNYPTTSLTEIERDRNGYQIELTNGLEIEFNNRFQVVDIDD